MKYGMNKDDKIDISVATIDEKYIIVNLSMFWYYDMAEFHDMGINDHGVFEDERNASWPNVDYWWRRPGCLVPYLFRVDGRAAGFCLVGTGPGNVPVGKDYLMHQFFVVREFRRNGVGTAAASAIIEKYTGKWEIRALLGNAPAIEFWRATVGPDKFTGCVESKRYCVEDSQELVCFEFETGNA